MEFENKLKKVIESLDFKFSQVRAGRANPNILSGIKASYYGVETPLQSLANITIPEAKKIFIKPFDRSTIKDIEKAINEANIGLNPINNGEMVILTIPDLTEERRKDYVKQIKELAEEAKIALRNHRQDENNDIKALELSEDEEKKELNNVQELINKYNKIIDDKAKEKETELMQV